MFFAPRMMASQFDGSYLKTAVFSGEVGNGALCILGDPHTNLYGGKDMNAKAATAPAAVATDVLYVVDTPEVPYVTDANGNVIKFGSDVTSLTVPADTPVRVRRLAIDDEFEVTGDNFVSTTGLAIGKFASGTNDSTKWTKQETATGGKVICKVIDSVTKSKGGYPASTFTVWVLKVVAA